MPLSHLDALPEHISTRFHSPDELLQRTDIAISQLYEWHAKENPDYPLFVYHDGSQRQYLTYSVANRAMDRVARYVAHSVGVITKEANPKQLVVGLLASTDSITYFCTAIGIMRAGCSAFLVSTRNGSDAVADMLRRTEATHIFVSSDTTMQEVSQEALTILANAGQHLIKLPAPTHEDIFSEELDPKSPFMADVQLPTSYDMNAFSNFLHSSGSTGHPKPIGWTHKVMMRSGFPPLRSETDMKGAVMGCHGIPMFHGMGAFMYASAPIMGFVVAVFKPASPPTSPTPDAVWQGIVDTGTDYSWTVPSFVEEWARDPAKVLHMKKMRGLMFGGAELNVDVGNSLAAQGISLNIIYGCTEATMISRFARPNPGKDWLYWEVDPDVECLFRPVEDDMYEFVVLSSPEIPLPRVNTKVGHRDAYTTSDLVLPHPTKTGLWRLVGRTDEQIILSNGEKTNPVPLEKIVNEDPRVKSAIMFGRGKFQNGILVEPIEEESFDPYDVKKLDAFRNEIWSTIERLNRYAPGHSRIFKEMILVASPTKPFDYTVKNMPRRGIVLRQYHEEIEALYRGVERNVHSEIRPPPSWDVLNTKNFVRDVVNSVLRRTIPDDTDIFRNGGDSLQATWIRNIILRVMRAVDSEAPQHLPSNFVFSNPTISSLAEVISRTMSGVAPTPQHTPEDLWKYVEKHSAELPERPENLVERPNGKDVVLITGTTGGFGCDTLEHLLKDENVGLVYALNRKGTNAMERQRAQFRARGLDETVLDSPKFRLVEAVLHEPDFGIRVELLEEVRTSLTHIMHNAWKVDFNLSIASFETDMQAARNLVNLALASPYQQPPSIVFVSSIGIFNNNYKIVPPVREKPVDDPSIPFGTGYSEAKWVVERVLQNATAKTGVHTVVVRLGQVAGNRLGYWNEREWFPALVKSALSLRCLPDFTGSVSWIPSYEGAKAFAELRHSSEPIVHLVHPRPTPWRTIIAPIAQVLNVPLVPAYRWLSALEGSALHAGSESAIEMESMKCNPALGLISFYQARGKDEPEEKEPMGHVHLATEHSTKASTSLASMSDLGGGRSRLWVAAWQKSGFLGLGL